MKQTVDNKLLQEAGRAMKSENSQFTANDYMADNKRIGVDFGKLTKDEATCLIGLIRREMDNLSNPSARHYQTINRKLTDWLDLTANATAETKVEKLELLPAAIKGFMQDAPHRWVFRQEPDQSIAPYFLQETEYHKAYVQHGTYYPARVHVTLAAYKRGSKVSRSFNLYANDLPSNVPRILSRMGRAYKETPEAVERYQEQFKRFTGLMAEVGLQMHADGEAEESDNSTYWSRTQSVSMTRDGVPTKVILDDDSEEGVKSTGRTKENSDRFMTDQFWKDVEKRDGMTNEERPVDEDEDPNQIALPIHPYLRCFDIESHRWVVIHQDNLRPYPWDKDLGSKLVLRQSDKDLVGLLCNQTGAKVDDIVKGKMAGVIVLATGTPGIGKTLTAEVFSEIIEKPLYTVQCSQLGLDVKQIEENLGKILSRAARWNAILLVDEADVYIRRRGEDIHQNAIVGVFLRLLEYYRGVIFMTSNRGEEIDDAILSRATAWIRYEKPDAPMLAKLWRILGRQYGADFTDKQIGEIMKIKGLETISGRTVRNLLKLARLLAGDGGAIGPKDIERVAGYQALD